MLTHLRRELMQEVWLILMDDDFMHAYIHGIMQVFYPQFFTYSADYPEK